MKYIVKKPYVAPATEVYSVNLRGAVAINLTSLRFSGSVPDFPTDNVFPGQPGNPGLETYEW